MRLDVFHICRQTQYQYKHIKEANHNIDIVLSIRIKKTLLNLKLLIQFGSKLIFILEYFFKHLQL